MSPLRCLHFMLSGTFAGIPFQQGQKAAVSFQMVAPESLLKRRTPARYAPGSSTKSIAAASDGSPSATLEQPLLVTITHWTTPFR
jgi:hypothetical protein